MDPLIITALAHEDKEQRARETEEFYRDLRAKLAESKKRAAKPGQLSVEERAKRTEDAFANLRGMLDMSLEEQVATQMACITQSVIDCMVRASVDEGVMPADARQSIRHAELVDQARLHDSGSRMLEALTRMRGNSAFTFNVNHIREGDAPPPHPKS
ncbi:MAG TPA: hypothetical protein VHL34_22280 [Rhizomicrobium sp.]|nr:hypothetical protein [Rhizomicrobium sp.]